MLLKVLTVLLELSTFVSIFEILLLQLSEFRVNLVNDCLYCINCPIRYEIDELRSRYNAKLQHVFLTFSYGVFLQ